MKKTMFIAIVLAAELFAPSFIQAQGTLEVSNLGQTPTGSAAIGSDSWFAAIFNTGTNAGGYTLNSVQLLMGAASGSPSGFNVSIYSFNNFEPGNSLGSLGGSDPSAGGIFTYTASNIPLSPYTGYFIVLTTLTPVTDGYYNWSIANTPHGYTSSDGWGLGAGYSRSSDGLSWAFTRPLPLQFAVDATAVPEPATLALAGLGLTCLSLWRRRH